VACSLEYDKYTGRMTELEIPDVDDEANPFPVEKGEF